MYRFAKGSIGRPMVNSQGAGNVYPAAVGDINGNPVAHHGMFVTCSDCWNTAQIGFGGPCVIRPTLTSSPDAPNRDLLQKGALDGWENGVRVSSMNNVTFTSTGIQKGNPKGPTVSKSGKTKWNNMIMLNYEAGFYR